MKFSVRKAIDKVGLRKLEAVSGIPYRTLFRWRAEDRIPGNEAAREWRLNQLKAAIERAQEPGNDTPPNVNGLSTKRARAAA